MFNRYEKKMRRILSISLACFLIIGVVPLVVIAGGEGGYFSGYTENESADESSEGSTEGGEEGAEGSEGSTEGSEGAEGSEGSTEEGEEGTEGGEGSAEEGEEGTEGGEGGAEEGEEGTEGGEGSTEEGDESPENGPPSDDYSDEEHDEEDNDGAYDDIEILPDDLLLEEMPVEDTGFFGTIIFDFQGGHVDGGEYHRTTAFTGQLLADIGMPEPVKEDYILFGWSVEPGGEIINPDTFTIEANFFSPVVDEWYSVSSFEGTLYAVWGDFEPLFAPLFAGVIMTPGDLADAINNATDGDVLEVGAHITLTATNAIAIDGGRNITLTSVSGGNFTIYQNTANQRHFNVVGSGSTLTLQNITLSGAGGTGTRGGVSVSAGGTLNMQAGSVIEHNSWNFNGGGVFVNGGTLNMTENAAIRNNTVTGRHYSGGGVLITNESTFNMSDNAVISDNIVDGPGGLPHGGGNSGGVDVRNGSTFNMSDGEIFNNSANGWGAGGVRVGGGVGDNLSTFNMKGGVIRNNRAFNAGGVAVGGTDGVVDGPDAVNALGGIFVMSGNATIRDNEARNSSGTGGGNGGGVLVSNNGIFTMRDNAQIVGNKAYGRATGATTNGYGGGVRVSETGEFNMEGGTIQGNISENFGAGVSVANGTFTMFDGLITSNNVLGVREATTFRDGGGVFIAGSNGVFHMYGGTISHNNESVGLGDMRPQRGGGVFVNSGARFEMNGLNAKIESNVAAHGGGVFVYNTGSFTMNNGTITGNRAVNHGGGVYWTNAGANPSTNTIRINAGDISNNTSAAIRPSPDAILTEHCRDYVLSGVFDNHNLLGFNAPSRALITWEVIGNPDPSPPFGQGADRIYWRVGPVFDESIEGPWPGRNNWTLVGGNNYIVDFPYGEPFSTQGFTQSGYRHVSTVRTFDSPRKGDMHIHRIYEPIINTRDVIVTWEAYRASGTSVPGGGGRVFVRHSGEEAWTEAYNNQLFRGTTGNFNTTSVANEGYIWHGAERILRDDGVLHIHIVFVPVGMEEPDNGGETEVPEVDFTEPEPPTTTTPPDETTPPPTETTPPDTGTGEENTQPPTTTPPDTGTGEENTQPPTTTPPEEIEPPVIGDGGGGGVTQPPRPPTTRPPTTRPPRPTPPPVETTPGGNGSGNEIGSGGESNGNENSTDGLGNGNESGTGGGNENGIIPTFPFPVNPLPQLPNTGNGNENGADENGANENGGDGNGGGAAPPTVTAPAGAGPAAPGPVAPVDDDIDDDAFENDNSDANEATALAPAAGGPNNPPANQQAPPAPPTAPPATDNMAAAIPVNFDPVEGTISGDIIEIGYTVAMTYDGDYVLLDSYGQPVGYIVQDADGNWVLVPDPSIPLGNIVGVQKGGFKPLWLLLLLLLPLLRTSVDYHTDIDKKPYRIYLWRFQKHKAPQAFVVEGYELEGWYKNKTLDEDKKWDFGKRVFIRKNLYANWLPESNFVWQPDSEADLGVYDIKGTVEDSRLQPSFYKS